VKQQERSEMVEQNIGAAAFALLATVSNSYRPLPGDPDLKKRLVAENLIERGFSEGVFGMYRLTKAGRSALTTGAAR
jgi:hypothetical protein